MNSKNPSATVHRNHPTNLGHTVAMLLFLSGAMLNSQAEGDVRRTCEIRADLDAESQECPCISSWVPLTQDVKSILTSHEKWLKHRQTTLGKFSTETSESTDGGEKALFCNALIGKGEFSRVDLTEADFRGSDILSRTPIATVTKVKIGEKTYDTGSKGRTPDILGVDFSGATLNSAQFQGAHLKKVNLSGASLEETNFTNADLTGADLTGAILVDTELKGARFEGVNLSGATYAPRSPPSEHYLGNIRGLQDAQYPQGRPAGLVKLRQLLRESGYRELERKATYAIEINRTLALVDECPWSRDKTSRKSFFGFIPSLGCVHGIIRTVLFEQTTFWGLSPGRALIIMISIVFVLAPIYGIGLLISQRFPQLKSGIFVVIPQDRIEYRDAVASISDGVRLHPLTVPWFKFPLWMLYFSILTSFQIGWRDLNVGTWIVRLQFSEYMLRSTGWMRCLAGIQSMVSVYLIAISALTYFGRPFQ